MLGVNAVIVPMKGGRREQRPIAWGELLGAESFGTVGSSEGIGSMEMEEHARILIVTGAHLRAEALDRPLAYLLREKVIAWLRQNTPPPAKEGAVDARVVVCSDIWYMNQDALRAKPTISVGGPEVNAFTAYVASRLPSLFAVEAKLIVQGEPSFEPPIVAVWGAHAEQTGRAMAAFEQRYLDAFLRAVMCRV